MSDAPRPDPQLIFTYLHGMLRAAGLYLPTHPQTRRAKQTLFDALTAYLAGQGRLTYRFMGDLLVANDRILPRESLLYRRFLETCQTERGLGAIAFTQGLQDREIDALLEALTEGVGLIDRRVDRQPSAHPPPPGAAEPAGPAERGGCRPARLLRVDRGAARHRIDDPGPPAPHPRARRNAPRVHLHDVGTDAASSWARDKTG